MCVCADGLEDAALASVATTMSSHEAMDRRARTHAGCPLRVETAEFNTSAVNVLDDPVASNLSRHSSSLLKGKEVHACLGASMSLVATHYVLVDLACERARIRTSTNWSTATTPSLQEASTLRCATHLAVQYDDTGISIVTFATGRE